MSTLGNRSTKRETPVKVMWNDKARRWYTNEQTVRSCSSLSFCAKFYSPVASLPVLSLRSLRPFLAPSFSTLFSPDLFAALLILVPSYSYRSCSPPMRSSLSSLLCVFARELAEHRQTRHNNEYTRIEAVCLCLSTSKREAIQRWPRHGISARESSNLDGS